MRIVCQRVTQASVSVDGKVVGQIQRGLLVLVGIGHSDTIQQVKWMADKTAQLRIFEDDAGKMNLSLLDVKGAALVVSQFTLLADCRKGRRPAFTDAADPKIAKELYLQYADLLSQHGVPVERGIFAADMKVSLVNDGPVTLVIDREA